jgi:hypothetical protein
MALLYHATLTPSKLDLLRAWIPGQPWIGDVDVSTLEGVGAYRFDDPDGEVGIETHLIETADGRILQVPVTYRSSRLTDAEWSLIATAQHSVLGERWVYDGCGDPVYVTALATAVISGGSQAEIHFVTDSGQERLEETTRAWGSGSPHTAIPPTAPRVSFSSEGTTTVISAGQLELTVVRVIDREGEIDLRDTQTLFGSWPARDVPALLALVRTT